MPLPTLTIFDPAMCCSTGVCGPSVDPRLTHFAADLKWLSGEGVSVERFNLAQQPGAFANDSAVKEVLESRGEAGLPLIKVDGIIKSSGSYPTRQQLAEWVGIHAPTSSEAPKKSPCCGGAASDATPPTNRSGCC